MSDTHKIKKFDELSYPEQVTFHQVGHLSELKDDCKVHKVYQLEYISNPKKWDRFVQEDVEWWDVCETNKFEDIQRRPIVYPSDGEAISAYIDLYLRKDVFDVKLFEQIYVNDELVQERYFEPDIGFVRTVINNVKDGTTTVIDKLREENDEMKKELDLYKQFIETFHAEETFKEFKEAQFGEVI